ncbi:MAG TPA: DMT family transporter [Burkholderiaceae bacterium]|nr:DMT family transporter [Burkholderiaceae bacterium]
MNRETRGLWLGFIGVVLFSATLPMTKLATGPFDAPQLSPVFVTFGRAALAGILSIFYLAFSRSPIPKKGQWGALFFTGLCVIIGFPLFMAMGLRHVESVHASVIMGILPLATAAIGSLWLGQRPSVGFWACAVAGSALVMAFVLLRASPASSQEAGMGANWADLLLLLAVLSASCGYVSGAQLTPSLGAERVICWVLVISLPLTVPMMLINWPPLPVRPSAWLGFGYVTLFSMWIGFFAWYRGLALGGTVRVSQVQLVQPFLSMLFSVPLLGESLDVVTVGFALAVIATVFIGKRMPVAQGASA